MSNRIRSIIYNYGYEKVFSEEQSSTNELNVMFTNIENNGAPWQYPAADRLNWKNE